MSSFTLMPPNWPFSCLMKCFLSAIISAKLLKFMPESLRAYTLVALLLKSAVLEKVAMSWVRVDFVRSGVPLQSSIFFWVIFFNKGSILEY